VVKLSTLGTLELTLPAGRSAANLTPKTLALLVYLMVTGKVHQRDQLATLFWRESPVEQARKNLRYLLPDLRHLLSDYLLITQHSIAFNRQQPYWLDVEILRTALTASEPLHDTPKLQATLDLYHGEFLAGFTVRNAPAFEAWVMHQREELHTLVMQGSYRLAEHYWQQGDYQTGLATTRRLLQWEPWHEASHRLQMELLMATGQRSAALQQYALCRQVLADELDIEPEAATIALYEQIRRGAYDKVASDKVKPNHPVTLSPPHPVTASPPHPLAQPAPPHNVPHQLTSFIGRAEEVAELSAYLHNPTYRVVTIVGEGGIGKTRLALAVAQRLSENASLVNQQPFADGIWFVSLNALAATPDLADKIATAIANALHHGLVGYRAPFHQLQSYLHTKRLLLILDGVEHLLPAIKPVLTRLLEHNPQICLLVTTRTLLNLPTEYVKRVAGLALPDLAESASHTTMLLTACSSVQLFLVRAQQVAHTFTIDAANQDAIVAICRFLGGLPLGIELAAAQTKYYTCDQIYQSLQHNSQLLATSKRDLPERHRNIRSVLEDSWRLLPPEAAMALSRLAVFPGSFSLEAAMKVAVTDGATLCTLVEHSLLREVSTITQRKRFLLHDLVRQYALEQLQMNADALAQTQQRFGEYFAVLLEKRLPTLFQTAAARRFLHMDLHNLRQAWQWMVAERQMPLLNKSLLPLTLFHLYNGSFQEMATVCGAALVTLRPALAQADDRATQQIVSNLLAHYAYHLAFGGQLDKAVPAAQEARRLAAALGDEQAQMIAYFSLNLIASVQGSLPVDQARTALHFAYRCAESPPYFTILLLADLGRSLTNAGALTEAMTTYEEALRLAQAFELRLLEAILYHRLSQMQMHLGDWARVYALAQQASAIYQVLQYIPGNLHTLSAFVVYSYALGDYAQADHWSSQILHLCETYHVHDEIELAAFLYQGKVQRYLGQRAQAHKSLVMAVERSEQLGNLAYQAWAKTTLAHLRLEQDAWQEAQALGEAALAVTALPEAATYRVAAQTLLALVAWRCQDWSVAAAYLAEVYTVLTTGAFDEQQEIPWICLTCYELWAAHGDQRAQEIIARGYDWLQSHAAKISEEATRRAFLQNVPEHRQLLALARPPTLQSAKAAVASSSD
jgi:predicted ATPase/DNA-binding SARP family transcriptional activator